ncbi:GL17678 [Drosophila persimilis]|uniref:Cytoplasmic phosphatidylinositol transfer protein 1 n=1 Tax=Drosophila persimilis TaxID=7234 RepID=B4GIA4_DROPE|nr:cytoplasmic phosphatidylinositol transfer protein 1 [Drosophila persimilis]EDW36224.1 GL17678 [Drosophila persimilis]
MVLTREYRVCMPLTVEEYKIGQLYMIARHSLEQSEEGEGVEVVENRPCEDAVHGKGQYTEKHIHLSSRLPYWVQAICPRVFYVIEKSWNYYPYTLTEYTCSFIPKLHVLIKTKYEDNNGTTENCLDLTEEELKVRSVDHPDIAFDEFNAKHYKREEDPKFFKSEKTGRGPLIEGWRETDKPIMCSYKVVHASFEVWGLQTKVEDFIQRGIRDILLLGHRQAFAWLDEWHGMTLEDVRDYERKKQAETNERVQAAGDAPTQSGSGSNGRNTPTQDVD